MSVSNDSERGGNVLTDAALAVDAANQGLRS